MFFIDFTKVFDTIDRTIYTLWKMLLKLGFLGHITNLTRDLHTGMRASVKLKDELSSQCQVNNGVKKRMCTGSQSLLHNYSCKLSCITSLMAATRVCRFRAGLEQICSISTSTSLQQKLKVSLYENLCLLMTLLLLPIVIMMIKRLSAGSPDLHRLSALRSILRKRRCCINDDEGKPIYLNEN